MLQADGLSCREHRSSGGCRGLRGLCQRAVCSARFWVSVTFVLVQLVMFLDLLHRLAEGRQHPTRPHVCRDDISPSQSAGVRLEMAKVCRWALCCRVLAVTQSPVPLPGHAASKLPDPCKAWDGGAVAGTARCPLAPCFGQLTAARGMLLPGQIPGVWLGLLSYTLQIL